MNTSTHHRRRITTLAAVGLAAVALVACGSDDDESATSGPVSSAPASSEPIITEPATSEPASTEPATTDTGEPDTSEPDTTHGHDAATVTIGARDYAFDDVPASVEVGTKLSLNNTSAAELHELVAFRLPDDETRPVTELATLPMEELGVILAGEPAAVLIAPPGAESIAVVGDGVLNEAGRYVLICAIPVGADPAEYMAAAQNSDGPPQVEGGPPHFTAGMFAELTVV